MQFINDLIVDMENINSRKQETKRCICDKIIFFYENMKIYKNEQMKVINRTWESNETKVDVQYTKNLLTVHFRLNNVSFNHSFEKKTVIC